MCGQVVEEFLDGFSDYVEDMQRCVCVGMSMHMCVWGGGGMFICVCVLWKYKSNIHYGYQDG